MTADIQQLNQQLAQARQQGDQAAEAQSHTRLGKHYLSRNQYQEARRHYRKAVDLFSQRNMVQHLARALNHLSVCQLMLRDPEGAAANLKRAQALLAEDQNSSLHSAVLGNLGLAYQHQGDYAKAAALHQQALDSGKKQADPQLEIQSRTNLAEAYLYAGRLNQAYQTALQALDQAQDHDAQPAMIALNDLLGMISSRRKDLPQAVRYHQQAAALAEETGDLHRQAIALANQALALEGLTELKRARQIMQQAHDIFQALQSNYRKKTQKDLQRINRGLESD